MNPITFNFTGSFTYTVPVTGTYDLSAFGAGGGQSVVGTPGNGAEVGGTFNLTAGQQLQIIVGGQGVSNSGNSGGGGGLSEVLVNSGANGAFVPLLIAGGGGGSGSGTNDPGGNAPLFTPENALGNGGRFTNGGGGGAGALSNGGSGLGGATGGSTAPTYAGGQGSAAGGFGGGGGSSGPYGGGGAGATGGEGGSADARGGGDGGTSYLSSAGTLNAAETRAGPGTNVGNGSVRILAPAAPDPTPTPTPTPTPPNPISPANNAPCYCTGTRILTWRDGAEAEVAVEALAIGDVVVTASGAHRPIRWIGTRGYLGRFANANPAVLPICVKAGALSDGVPARDLWVSPDHAFYLDGVLIPAEHLVNGASIVKADRVEAVTYWHVELDSHDVLLAEGAAAESFVDDGGRAIFHNAASYRALYPHRATWPTAAVYCAERVTDGYGLEAVRRRLAIRAGLRVAPERAFGELRGHLDLCAAGADGSLRVAGWAQDLAHPDGPVCLDVVVDGAVVALAHAETHRPDLAAAGVGDGCHAFDLTLAGPRPGSVVTVRRSADAAVLGTARVYPVDLLAAA